MANKQVALWWKVITIAYKYLLSQMFCKCVACLKVGIFGRGMEGGGPPATSFNGWNTKA